uniref:Uncharacterized protein n=1 Tax=Chlamydomonas euryale TaxID=1486919 RepID=A0A7R9V2T2_9CHLO
MRECECECECACGRECERECACVCVSVQVHEKFMYNWLAGWLAGWMDVWMDGCVCASRTSRGTWVSQHSQMLRPNKSDGPPAMRRDDVGRRWSWRDPSSERAQSV